MEATNEASHSNVHVENGALENRLANGVGSPDGGSDDDARSGGSCEPRAEVVGVGEKWRVSSASECSVDVDLERGVLGVKKAHFLGVKKECRICQLSLDSGDLESGIPIELGCSCKDDLAAAHLQCASAWFKIRGNKTCEICGAVVSNAVCGDGPESMGQWDEPNETASVAAASARLTETQRFLQGRKFLNFLLGCMVFAFVLFWLFHFNVPDHPAKT